MFRPGFSFQPQHTAGNGKGCFQPVSYTHLDLKQLRLMIDLCSTGATVGMLDLYDFDPHHRRAGVGILVDPLYQKNGLATEALELLAEYAFSYLKLHQLFVHIPIGNEPSKALFARCGFTVTGILTVSYTHLV